MVAAAGVVVQSFQSAQDPLLACVDSRLESERAADRLTIQTLQTQTQQQLAALASQQQQRMATLQQQAAAAAASSSAESAAVVSGAVGLAGELGDRQAAVLKDLAGLAVEVSKYRYVGCGSRGLRFKSGSTNSERS